MLLNTLLLALRAIRRNLLRSFLTMLGIVIGVSAVITMVTLGNGATRSMPGADRQHGQQPADGAPGPAHRAGRKARPTSASPTPRRCASNCAMPWPWCRWSSASVTVVRNAEQLVHHRSPEQPRTISPRATGAWRTGASSPPAEQRAGAAVCVIGETVRKELFGARTRSAAACA